MKYEELLEAWQSGKKADIAYRDDATRLLAVAANAVAVELGLELADERWRSRRGGVLVKTGAVPLEGFAQRVTEGLADALGASLAPAL